MYKKCDLVLKTNYEIFCYTNYQLKYRQFLDFFLIKKAKNKGFPTQISAYFHKLVIILLFLMLYGRK